ncbi:MAG: glycosyltransferase family 2 protein [Desulfovibrionaceae bacterium]|nr:glycosyltransferase family 2 protein [Desulfovibrionaceae bacterium]
MNLKDTLEIFIITYNRKPYLQKTFDQIFSENSPIKDLKITILDNKSTDGTSELIEEYIKIFHNIRHIVHSYNIGGNANIARAFETASSKFVWIICDDDEYDFSYWNEVQNAIDEEKNLIVVANYLKPKESKVNLIKQLTFVPAGIYKVSNFNSTMMINMHYCISSMFPQMAIFADIINKQKEIYICQHWCVRMKVNEDAAYTRGVTGFPHPYMKDCFWHSGFATAIQLFENKNLRKELMDNIDLDGQKGFRCMVKLASISYEQYNNRIRNLFDLFSACSAQQKISLILAILYYYILLIHICKIKIFLKKQLKKSPFLFDLAKRFLGKK